jgi:hypothetical protein
VPVRRDRFLDVAGPGVHEHPRARVGGERASVRACERASDEVLGLRAVTALLRGEPVAGAGALGVVDLVRHQRVAEPPRLAHHLGEHGLPRVVAAHAVERVAAAVERGVRGAERLGGEVPEAPGVQDRQQAQGQQPVRGRVVPLVHHDHAARVSDRAEQPERVDRTRRRRRGMSGTPPPTGAAPWAAAEVAARGGRSPSAYRSAAAWSPAAASAWARRSAYVTHHSALPR